MKQQDKAAQKIVKMQADMIANMQAVIDKQSYQISVMQQVIWSKDADIAIAKMRAARKS